MKPTLHQLHRLVDIVNPNEYDIVYKLLTKYIDQTEPFPDEIAAIKKLDAAILNNDTVSIDDVDWD